MPAPTVPPALSHRDSPRLYQSCLVAALVVLVAAACQRFCFPPDENSASTLATAPAMDVHAHLHAIVDMGSNGIRFSISDLSPPTARIMPTLFQDRAAISLYDAQWSSGSKAPIPDPVIQDVLTSFKRFRRTCTEFGVPPANVRVLATEATREAVNSRAFRDAIHSAVGWSVEMLPKEEEGRVGAMGVASSFTNLSGLVMDLGGGSTQLSWMRLRSGQVHIGTSISLPLGAAALSRRLDEAESAGAEALRALETDISARIADSLSHLDTLGDQPIAQQQHISLLLSGGGFRGWGYTLMDLHSISPYPIPIINGFHALPAAFKDTKSVKQHAASAEIFRISERRAGQVPAVALLIRSLVAALPSVSLVRFCQGGVREGALFSSMTPDIRAQQPITVATLPYAPKSASDLLALLRSALPEKGVPAPVTAVLEAFVNTLYIHLTMPKEARAPSALRMTTTGILAGTHGLIHEERAALALLLCQRWEGQVSPTHRPFFDALEQYAGPRVVWWARYLGRIGQLLGEVYPAGVVRDERLALRCTVAKWSPDGAEPAKMGLLVTLRGMDGDEQASYTSNVRDIEKVGKKKHWVGGEDGFGVKIEAAIGGA